MTAEKKDKKERKEHKRVHRKQHRREGERKEHRRERKRRRREGGASSGSSDSDPGRAEAELARGRAAARATRSLLWDWPDAAPELRELLRALDQGAGVDLADVGDAALRAALEGLLGAAGLRPGSARNTLFSLPPRSPRLLPLLAPVLNEPRPAGPPPRSPPRGAAAEAPAFRPPSPPTASVRDEPAAEEAPAPAGPIGPTPPPPRARVLGPAAPPPEVLAALVAEQEADDVGPPPPELVAEADAAPAGTREEQVRRIVEKLEERRGADAYELLGVEEDATTGEIRKAYFKLSLLIHPDKCTHERAQDAFDALSKAKGQLMDAEKRAALDEKRGEARLCKEFEAVWEQRLQQARWRQARGEATVEDRDILAGPSKPTKAARDEWMTELPPERKAGVTADTMSRLFSKRGREERGDTSAWTDTPQLAAAREAQGRLMSAADLALEAARRAEGERAATNAAAVDQFNERRRPKSLVEQHQERLAQQASEAKRKRKAGQQEPAPDWQKSGAPWRPFDRERDLKAPASEAGARDMLKDAGTLSSRFGGGSSGGRRFL